MVNVGMLKPRNIYEIECIGPTGNLKWREGGKNIVVNQGLDHSLSIITATAHVAAWHVGLTATAASFAAADTLASHAGWTEITPYTGDRKAFTAGAISSQSVDNSASKASFAITTAATTIGGAFMCSVSSGTAGILYGGATIAARAVANGDTVNVTITCGAEVT